MAYEMIEVRIEADKVGIITLNRPEAKNAATAEMAELMVQAIDQLESRDDLSVGIITGAGGTFCAGMDLKAASKKPPGRMVAPCWRCWSVVDMPTSRSAAGPRSRAT